MMPKKQAYRDQHRQRDLSDPMLAVITTQLRAVMGPIQERNDVVLVGEYERDREICEEAIRKALAELADAGEEVDARESAVALAWAWRNLDEAYIRLAHVQSRAKLAVRRAEVERLRAEKARKE
jgi:hypothetical protein